MKLTKEECMEELHGICEGCEYKDYTTNECSCGVKETFEQLINEHFELKREHEIFLEERIHFIDEDKMIKKDFETVCQLHDELLENYNNQKKRMKQLEQENAKLEKALDNPPLKFEELHNGMLVWDNFQKEYIKCFEFRNRQWIYHRFADETMYILLFQKNRFFRYEVKEDEVR